MRKTPSHTEKKMVYSIRSLKNGTGSVLIGASLVLLAMATPTISANENTTSNKGTSNETTTALAQPLTDTANIAGKNESDFSSTNNANASLEKKEEKPEIETLLHQTIKKLTIEIDEFKFNTSISQLMILVNKLSEIDQISKQTFEALIIMLAPFAPHLAEEFWEKLGNEFSLFTK